MAAAEVSVTGRERPVAYLAAVLPEVLLRDNPVTARRLVPADVLLALLAHRLADAEG